MPASKRPLKRFSQNFLVNTAIQKKIIAALAPTSEDTVLEIGPGKGALTGHLVQSQPSRLFAVEIDTRWVQLLKEKFAGQVEVVQNDFMQIELADFIREPAKLKVIGNLPYHITSPILFRLFDHYHLLDSAVLMMQKEVARRLVAQPRTKDYGILSVVTQTYAQTEYLFDVKPGNFFPVPAVDSAVIKLNFYNAISDLENEQLWRQLVRATFNTRRKMLRNSLGRNIDKSTVYSLTSVSLDKRPEELTISEFKTLANELHHMNLRTTHGA